MDLIVLRLIHIGAGAFWVGSVFTFFLFVQPAAAAIGPDGAKFMYQLIHHRRLSVVILAFAIVTVLAGLWLLVITSNGLDPDVLFSEARLGYTVGGISAILTLAVGGLYVFPRTKTVERTIGRMADGRPPTPDEQALLARTAGESRRAGWVVLTGLAIAVTAMATASLWPLVL